jgi:hypothetical protein
MKDKGVEGFFRIYEFALISNTGVICENIKDQHNIIVRKIPHLMSASENVLAICGAGGIQTYHFVIDYLSSFLHLIEKDFSQYKVLVEKRNRYTVQWLKIIRPDVLECNIIEAKYTIAENLISITNGHPGAQIKDRVNFLRSRVMKTIKSENKRDLLVLSKRNYSRLISNWDELRGLCELFCEKFNLKLYIHDDKSMPSVEEQLLSFASARIVLGSHGAGFVNILACEQDTLFIECKYQDRDCGGLIKEDPQCFEQLASVIGLNYKKSLVVDQKAKIDELSSLIADNYKK